MPEKKPVSLRLLPGGEFRRGFEAGWNNRVLLVDFPDEVTREGLSAGDLVELEAGTKLYLGVLQENRTVGVSVLVEHCLECSRLQWIQEVWG